MQKTKKSIVKRFKVTASGRVMRRTPGQRHLLRKKSVAQKRRAGSDKEVAAGHAKALLRGMPHI